MFRCRGYCRSAAALAALTFFAAPAPAQTAEDVVLPRYEVLPWKENWSVLRGVEDPDRFDVFRKALPHIGYGHGVHVCLGMHLARLEMSVALNRLFDRLPNLRLDPEGDDPHIRGQVFRSPTSLPVLFGD